MINYSNRCVYIREKKPQTVSEIMITPRAIVLRDDSGILGHGVINLAKGVYACLYSDDIRYISIITDGLDARVLTLYMDAQSEYKATVAEIIRICPSLTISSQNLKINSYANSVAEKLREGVELQIVDAVNEEDVVICPDCGVANDRNPSMPFCMECGAALEM